MSATYGAAALSQYAYLMTTIGASGAVFGILFAFGWLYPEVPMYIIFIPIPIRARTFVIIYALIELFAGLGSVAGFTADNVAHFAHLGGMLFGWLLILYWKKTNWQEHGELWNRLRSKFSGHERLDSTKDDKFDGYHWSSFSAFMKGDPTAVGGMRFIYGDDCSNDEIVERHTTLLEELLEAEKLRRAEEIARKRAAGYVMPTDHLTTEAMIAQQAAHLAEVQQAAMELQEARSRTNRLMDRRELTEKGICALLEASAGMEMHRIAERLSLGKSMTYRILGDMKKRGLVVQEGHGGVWRLPNSGK
jgi:hypothetical protein